MKEKEKRKTQEKRKIKRVRGEETTAKEKRKRQCVVVRKYEMTKEKKKGSIYRGGKREMIKEDGMEQNQMKKRH